MRIESLGLWGAIVAVVGCGGCGGGGGGGGSGDAGPPDGAVPLAKPGPCTVTYDSDNDGTAERISSFEYDARRHRIHYIDDQGADGTINIEERHTYDVDLLVRFQRDLGGDGVDRDELFEYDGDGDITLQRADLDGDGVYELVTTFTYDGEDVITISTDAPGTQNDALDERTYDDDGHLLTMTLDLGVDGVIEQYEVRSYDERGLADSLSVDLTDDGVFDYLEFYEHDEDGLLVRKEEDEGADGVDLITTYSHDGRGNLTRVEAMTAAGATIIVMEWDYDLDDHVTGFRNDYNGDGQWDAIVTVTYDEGGHPIREENDVDPALSPGIDLVRSWSYDDDGNVLRQETDVAADGLGDVDELIVYSYDGGCFASE